MPTVFNYIPITIGYVSCIVILINYVLLEQVKILPNIPDFFKYIVYSTLFYFIYGYSVSHTASVDKCNQRNKLRSSLHGLKSVLYVIVTYTVLYLFLPLRKPFIQLFGENKKGASIAEIFFISLNLIISIVTNYFDSIKETCKVTPDKLETNLKNLDKYLQQKPKRKRTRNIIVKD